MTDQEFKVVRAMERFGGGFVRALAECFHRADSINFQVLKNAFPDYWKEYEEMAENNGN